MALLVIYLVLGVLYESFIHPLNVVDVQIVINAALGLGCTAR
jgi:multidrug efflux pump subunit AcrB